MNYFWYYFNDNGVLIGNIATFKVLALHEPFCLYWYQIWLGYNDHIINK